MLGTFKNLLQGKLRLIKYDRKHGKPFKKGHQSRTEKPGCFLILELGLDQLRNRFNPIIISDLQLVPDLGIVGTDLPDFYKNPGDILIESNAILHKLKTGH